MVGAQSLLLPSPGLYSGLHQPPLAKELKGKPQHPRTGSLLPGTIPSLVPPPSFPELVLSHSTVAQGPTPHISSLHRLLAPIFLPPSNP